MKLANWGFRSAELALIAAISVCSTLAFTSSQLSSSIFQHVSNSSSAVPYASAIVWGLLFASGFLIIVVARQGGGAFALLAILVSLPSLLSFNSLNLARFLHLDSVAGQFQTDLSFSEVLVLGAGIMACYILINFIHNLKTAHSNLVKQGADPGQADVIYAKSHLALFMIVGVTIAAAALILVIALGIESLSINPLKNFSWGILLGGLGCILLIAIYIFWLASSRKSTP